jgi:hypothetical protein
MNLENIMLSEISQTQKDKYYMVMVLLIEVPRTGKSIELLGVVSREIRGFTA